MDMEIVNLMWTVQAVINSSIKLRSKFQKKIMKFSKVIKDFYPNIPENLAPEHSLDPFKYELLIRCRQCKCIFPLTHRSYYKHGCPEILVKKPFSRSDDSDLKHSTSTTHVTRDVLGCVLDPLLNISKFIATRLIFKMADVLEWNKDIIPSISYTFMREFYAIGSTMRPFHTKTMQHIINGSYRHHTTLGVSPINVQLYLVQFILNRNRCSNVTDFRMNQLMGEMQNSDDWSNIKLIQLETLDVLTAMNYSIDQSFHFGFREFVNIHHDDVLVSLFDAQPICRKVIICIRLIVREMGYGNNEWMKSFTGYILSLLTISYFQMRGDLPSVKTMQNGARQKTCEGYSVGFNPPENVRICNDSLENVLFGFFEFYLSFEFKDNIISPYAGQNIDKSPLDPTKNIQMFENKSVAVPIGWVTSSLCIQDIFAHYRNVANSVDSAGVRDFKHLCSTALNGLRYLRVGSSIIIK